MDVDRSGSGVEDAAVAVAALNQRPVRVLDGPRVLGCKGPKKSTQNKPKVKLNFAIF